MNPEVAQDPNATVIGKVSGTISAGNFKDVLKGLETLGDQTIFTFTQSGLTVGMIDNDCSTLVKYEISQTLFENYKFSSDNFDPIRLGVVVARMKDITKTLTTKDTLGFEYDSADPTVLTISAGPIKRSIKLVALKLLRELPSLPEANYEYNFDIPLKAVKDYLKAVAKVQRDFSFIVNESKKTLTLITAGDSPVELQLKPENWNCTKSSRTTYSIGKLAHGLAVGKKTNVTIYGGQDLNILFKWTQVDGFNCSCLLAPKLN